MAGQLVAFTPKKVGRSVRAGRSCATVESGKWVGPAKSAGLGRRQGQPDPRRGGRRPLRGQDGFGGFRGLRLSPSRPFSGFHLN
jgi:hypothetical protein